MKIKTDTPVESGQTTATTDIVDYTQLLKVGKQQIKVMGFEEIIYDKVIKLEEQVKIINKKLDEILGEEK